MPISLPRMPPGHNRNNSNQSYSDLVVRAIFFPRGDTFLRQLRQRISTEPAVMDDFRNHFVFLSILFIAIFYTERRQLNLASDTV